MAAPLPSPTAIEVLSRAPLSSASQQQLACRAVDGLLGYLRQEVHAGTAVVGVGVLGSWCGLLREEVPKPLLAHLKVWREGPF